MQLENFIKETLVSIIKGVAGASAEIKDIAQIDDDEFFRIDDFGENAEGNRYVDFDVAITATNENSMKGGAKASISVVGGSIDGEKRIATENISRVKFKVLYRGSTSGSLKKKYKLR